MKYVGKAVKDYGYFANGNEVTVFGIAPWGCVNKNKDLRIENTGLTNTEKWDRNGNPVSTNILR